MPKTAIACNSSEPKSVFPPLILGSSAAALGSEVYLFFTPAGAAAMVKGALEKLRGTKGLPDPVELYEGIRELGGRIYVCELALDAKDMKPEQFREGVEIVGATTFMSDTKDATITYSF